MPTKRDNVIQDVIEAMENGSLRLSTHAQLRMAERSIVLSDIEEAIYSSVREDHKDQLTKDGKDWKYALRGNSETGKDLRIVVLFDDPKVLVITAIDKD